MNTSIVSTKSDKSSFHKIFQDFSMIDENKNKETHSKENGAAKVFPLNEGSNRKKKLWTKEEDDQLRRLVQKNKIESKRGYQWTAIAKTILGRSGKQCRERWHNHLKPELKKGDWTHEEDEIILQMQAQIGNHWTKITKLLPGRTDNDVKNRWHSCVRNRNKENIPGPFTSLKPISLQKKKNGLASRLVLKEIYENAFIDSSHKKSVKKSSLNVVSFDDESREQIQDYGSQFGDEPPFWQEKYHDLDALRPKKKSRSEDETRPLPKIFSDIKTLDESYGHLLSPVRKDDKISLASKVHNIRLGIQRGSLENRSTLSPYDRSPPSTSAINHSDIRVDANPINLFFNPEDKDDNAKMIDIPINDWFDFNEKAPSFDVPGAIKS